MDSREVVREVLVKVTGLVDNEEIAGIMFATGLVITDHVFNILERLGLI